MEGLNQYINLSSQSPESTYQQYCETNNIVTAAQAQCDTATSLIISNEQVAIEPVANIVLNDFGSQIIIAENINQEVYNILNDWNLGHLYAILDANEIDMEALWYMDKTDVLELLKEQSLGTKIKFAGHLKEWQQKQDTISITTNGVKNLKNIATEPEPSTSSGIGKILKPSEPKFTLIDILKTTPTGKYLIKVIESKQQLSDENRSVLVDEIVTYFINQSIPMGVNECEDIAIQIEKYFQNEISNIYFQRRPNAKSKGKLYDKYNNRIAILRNNSLMHKPKRRRAEVPITENCEFDNSYDELMNDEYFKTVQQELKYNRNDNNLNEIFEKWTSTANNQCRWLKTNNHYVIDNIIQEWPGYAQAFGPKLIDIDFIKLYPKAKSVYINFDQFSSDLFPIMERKIVEPSSKLLIKEYQQQKNISSDARFCVILFLLHALLKPTTTKIDKRNQGKSRSYIKTTIRDSQNSFLIIGKTVAECEKNIEDQKNLKFKDKIRLQPFIIIIGENLFSASEFYVYCDDIKYKLPSILAALDCTFKLFHVFNVEYPYESKTVWQFIQVYLYGIRTNYDEVYPSIDLLISKLNKVT